MQNINPNRLKLFGTELASQNTVVNEQAVTSPILSEEPQVQRVPAFFDGRVAWKGYVGPILDQGACGACYSYAVTSCLQDKFRLFTQNKVQPVLNPLEAVVCHLPGLTPDVRTRLEEDAVFRRAETQRRRDNACRGGTLYDIARHFYRSGAVEDDCISAMAIQKALQENRRLPSCEEIAGPDENQCGPENPEAQRLWPVRDFYVVATGNDLRSLATYMKWDLCRHGPLAVGFIVYEDFLTEYDGLGIYIPRPGQPKLGGHAVKLIGWGVENSIEYWLCANSWGTDWGDHGYFRMQMANPLLETELNHLAVIPEVPGIEQFFSLTVEASAVRAVDLELRSLIDVNPYTLYDAATTRAIETNQLEGSLYPPIFNQLEYLPAPGIFGCGSLKGVSGLRTRRHLRVATQEPKSPWEDEASTVAVSVLLVTVIVSGGLGLAALWRRIL